MNRSKKDIIRKRRESGNKGQCKQLSARLFQYARRGSILFPHLIAVLNFLTVIKGIGHRYVQPRMIVGSIIDAILRVVFTVHTQSSANPALVEHIGRREPDIPIIVGPPAFDAVKIPAAIHGVGITQQLTLRSGVEPVHIEMSEI